MHLGCSLAGRNHESRGRTHLRFARPSALRREHHDGGYHLRVNGEPIEVIDTVLSDQQDRVGTNCSSNVTQHGRILCGLGGNDHHICWFDAIPGPINVIKGVLMI